MSSKLTAIESEVKKHRRDYSTDSYPMSLVEIESLYVRKEIILNPDFQRIFRWSNEQRSKFIESILLKIPVPSVFLYQRDDGKLEVVDGLQRISSWLSFQGVLIDEDDIVAPPLRLSGLRILKKLNGYTTDAKEQKFKIPESLVSFAKMQKLQLQIIGSDSDPEAKYEIFRRINTSGSFLSAQELRNALLVMLDKDFYEWLIELSENSDFLDAIALSDKLKDEKYNMELALKFLTLYEFGWSKGKDVSEYLDESAIKFLKMKKSKLVELRELFCESFKFMNKNLGDSSFKRWSKGKASGKFLESAFEAVCLGVVYNYDKIEQTSFSKTFKSKVIDLWSNDDFLRSSGSGSNAKSRIPKIISFSEKYFA